MLLAYIYRSITHRVHFLDKASRTLSIRAKDLFVAAKEETPANRGYVAGRGKLKQSGSKVQFGPSRSTRHRAERLLSGVVAETGTCSSLPKICLLKPRKARRHGADAYKLSIQGRGSPVWRRCQRCCRCSSCRRFAAMASNCFVISP